MPHRDAVFTGICTALVTPFDSRGEVDYTRLSSLIDEQISAGVSAVCICGTTGEASSLSLRERLDTIEFCCRYIDHRIKVLAGTGSNNTKTAALMSRHAQQAGADALLVVTPYYNKTSQAGLIRHYEYIAEQVDLPIILYNVPSRTGLSFTAETYQVLSRDPRINGVKEASGNLNLVSRTLLLCGEDFSVWSGNDDQVVAMMALGARGAISVAGNLLPENMVSMARLCLDGNFDRAAKLQLQLLPLIDALFSEVNPIPVKAAMKLVGKDAGEVRLPLVPLSEPQLFRLQECLSAMHLITEQKSQPH